GVGRGVRCQPPSFEVTGEQLAMGGELVTQIPFVGAEAKPVSESACPVHSASIDRRWEHSPAWRACQAPSIDEGKMGLCHPEGSLCHPERSEGSAPGDHSPSLKRRSSRLYL